MELRTPTVDTASPHEGGIEPLPPEASVEFTVEENTAIRIVAANLHRLNRSIAQAVASGLTIEILRSSRSHNETGNWGDQVVLNVARKG